MTKLSACSLCAVVGALQIRSNVLLLSLCIASVATFPEIKLHHHLECIEVESDHFSPSVAEATPTENKLLFNISLLPSG